MRGQRSQCRGVSGVAPAFGGADRATLWGAGAASLPPFLGLSGTLKMQLDVQIIPRHKNTAFVTEFNQAIFPQTLHVTVDIAVVTLEQFSQFFDGKHPFFCQSVNQFPAFGGEVGKQLLHNICDQATMMVYDERLESQILYGKIIRMNEIYTLLIELEDGVFRSDASFPIVWKRTVEFNADTTLNMLHNFIQQEVDFDDDHLYEFYVAKKARSKKARQFTCEGTTEEENRAFWQEYFPDKEYGTAPWIKEPWIREEPLGTPLNQVFPLPTGNFLFYLFDYGDSWRFKIRKTNRKQQFAAEGVEYPRVVGAEGENPKQYPMWDDDEDLDVEE